jgi:hypothetical protein
VLPLIWARSAAEVLSAGAGVAYGCAQLVLSHTREVEGLKRL